jgi:hypothetical protein
MHAGLVIFISYASDYDQVSKIKRFIYVKEGHLLFWFHTCFGLVEYVTYFASR